MRKHTSTAKAITKVTKSAGRSAAERIHVIPSEGNWAVMKEGSNRATRIYTRKQEAVDRARSIGKDGMIVVHHKDGTIESIHHAG